MEAMHVPHKYLDVVPRVVEDVPGLLLPILQGPVVAIIVIHGNLVGASSGGTRSVPSSLWHWGWLNTWSCTSVWERCLWWRKYTVGGTGLR